MEASKRTKSRGVRLAGAGAAYVGHARNWQTAAGSVISHHNRAESLVLDDRSPPRSLLDLVGHR